MLPPHDQHQARAWLIRRGVGWGWVRVPSAAGMPPLPAACHGQHSAQIKVRPNHPLDTVGAVLIFRLHPFNCGF